MLILSIDCAGSGCGAVVWHDGKVLAERTEFMERGQDQRLMPLILEIIKEAGITFAELDRIAVTRGPGSFTGLRIGLAAARGIGLAANKPVIGIDRFSIFRASAAELSKNLLIVIHSKRKELFCKFYPANGAPTEPTMMMAEEIADFLAATPNTVMIGDVSLPGISPLAISETVIAASLAAHADPHDSVFLPRPLYIRAPDVTMKKPVLTIQLLSTVQSEALTTIHTASFGAAAWTDKQMQGSLALDTTQGWVAIENGKPVGFILCQIVPDQIEILTFAVHPSAQRRGIGAKLLEQVRGTRVFLEVAADNGAACHLYEKHGFRRSGIRPNYYRRDTTPIDALLYEKVFVEQQLPKGK